MTNISSIVNASHWETLPCCLVKGSRQSQRSVPISYIKIPFLVHYLVFLKYYNFVFFLIPRHGIFKNIVRSVFLETEVSFYGFPKLSKYLVTELSFSVQKWPFFLSSDRSVLLRPFWWQECHFPFAKTSKKHEKIESIVAVNDKTQTKGIIKKWEGGSEIL